MKNIAQHLEDFRNFVDNIAQRATEISKNYKHKPHEWIKKINANSRGLKSYPIQDWMGLRNAEFLSLKCIGKNRYISEFGHVILTGFSPTGGQLHLSQKEFDNLCDIFNFQDDEACLIFLSSVDGTTGDIAIVFLNDTQSDFLYNNNLTNKQIRELFEPPYGGKHAVYIYDKVYRLDSPEVSGKILSHNREHKLDILRALLT